jgi:hypothetical protein
LLTVVILVFDLFSFSLSLSLSLSLSRFLSFCPSLQFRDTFCERGTADAQCMAPHDGGIHYDNVTDWCIATFDGQTDCADIREAAETDALEISRWV